MAQPSSAPPSASSEEDRALVVSALDGDQRSYEALVNKYQIALVRHVGKMVRDSQEVDDLVQEAFVKAFGSLQSYSPAYAFSTWLYRIATNHTIDYIRKKKLSTVSIDKPLQTGDGELKMDLPDTTYRPDKAIVTDQRNAILRDAIEQLPEKYHRVIVMRHQEEKTYDEIAEALDLPLGTVKAHIFRARALLNKYLRDRRDELE
ncbi:MAG: sigma-70 family RNA polymerase sigma factor [Bacteroidota bacterium]